MWEEFDNGNTINGMGSEGGIIICDEEYKESCRITLEKECEIAPYAITCGIYGFMVHTTFSGEAEVYQKYTNMKKDLAVFINLELDEDASMNWYDDFRAKY